MKNLRLRESRISNFKFLMFINSLIIITTLIVKSLLTSLCQREGKSPLERGVGVCNPSLVKRGKGRFFNQCQFNFETLNNSCKAGFTLLEVLIALAIVGGLLVTLIYTLNYHLSIIERQETITVSTLLAKNKIAELEKSRENKKGVFDAPYESYTYETFIKESPYVGISEIIVVVKAGKEEVKLNEFVVK
jgi:general secretion pathway protein I